MIATPEQPPLAHDPPDLVFDRFHRVYESSGTALLGYALRRSASREDALDVVADTFLVAWRRREDMPVDPEQARQWLFGIARWCLANLARRDRRSDRLGRHLAAHMTVEHLPDPVMTVQARADSQLVRQALDRLSPEDRELITLIAWEGLSPTQAGAALGISPGAVRVRLHRARARLWAALTPANQPVEDSDHVR